MLKIEPVSYSQRDGDVVLAIHSEHPDGAEVVIDHDSIMALLQSVMTALRVGNYDADTLNAAAMVCKANLMGRLR